MSSATDMVGMFFGTSFNGDLLKWDGSHVTDMSGVLDNAKFF